MNSFINENNEKLNFDIHRSDNFIRVSVVPKLNNNSLPNKVSQNKPDMLIESNINPNLNESGVVLEASAGVYIPL